MNFSRQLDQLYRDYAPRLFGALVAHLHHWDVAEDAMAEAFAKATALWPAQGWPDNPQAWLYRVAVHAAYDRQKQLQTQNKYCYALDAVLSDVDNDSQLLAPDQRLTMFFLCAHPSLSLDTQAMLMLRYCALLPTDAVARAFLMDEQTVSKRLQRAKAKLQDAGIEYEVPDNTQWAQRLSPVLAAIEVLYDQSYADISGGVEKESLARDAMQLGQTLMELLPAEPEVMALVSIMWFCESRRHTRLDNDGAMIPLDQQDTAQWNMHYISRGAELLARAVAMQKPGALQIRASIHAAHAQRKQFGSTPWPQIIGLYETLSAIDDSALVQINLAMAYAQSNQNERAQQLLGKLNATELKYLPAYHLAAADIHARRENYADASVLVQHALTFTHGEAERRYLQKQLASWRAKLKA
jgi:RNA polymerase sigma-70 factor, ECF subfamily